MISLNVNMATSGGSPRIEVHSREARIPALQGTTRLKYESPYPDIECESRVEAFKLHKLHPALIGALVRRLLHLRGTGQSTLKRSNGALHGYELGFGTYDDPGLSAEMSPGIAMSRPAFASCVPWAPHQSTREWISAPKGIRTAHQS